LFHRQQLAALDVHQRRSHHQELARDFQIQQAHRIDIFDELLGQFGEIDLINIDLPPS